MMKNLFWIIDEDSSEMILGLFALELNYHLLPKEKRCMLIIESL